MCEANVYLHRDGQEELLMESVDRIIPGEDNQIFMENIFGERRVVKARIREMELVRHRVILEAVPEEPVQRHTEIWLEPETAHGHFHPGEAVIIKLNKGYNMQADSQAELKDPKAYIVKPEGTRELELHAHHNQGEINLTEEIDGLAQIYVHEKGEQERYAAVLVEVGHHHHHGTQPIGLPLEIIPTDYSHARMGENYEIQVLKNGIPLAGAEVKATYSSTKNRDYPHHLTTDETGRAKLFLTARGNYLFSVTDENIISTFTLVKSF